MAEFLQRLKQRKLVQWAVAYLAAAWLLLQALDLAAGSYGWPHIVMQLAFSIVGLGFFVALPLVRAQVKAQAGSARNESRVWETIADAELGLGHTAAGLAAIAKSQALITRAYNHVDGPEVMLSNADLYADAHRPDLAVPLLARVLATPGIGDIYIPVALRFDPAWDPIRHDPRFQALLKKYAQYKPATAPAAATSASTP